MHQNELFAQLDHLSGGALRGFARTETLVAGAILATAEHPIEQALFPSSAIVSLQMPVEHAEHIDAGMVGRDSGLGLLAAFGACRHVGSAVCLMGGLAVSITIQPVADLARQSAEARELLLRHVQWQFSEAARLVGCAAVHSIEQRLASWLLRAMDATGRSELRATQELMANSLGIQRASVSNVAGRLGENGAIQYRRGLIKITDPLGLATRACRCHLQIARQKLL